MAPTTTTKKASFRLELSKAARNAHVRVVFHDGKRASRLRRDLQMMTTLFDKAPKQMLKVYTKGAKTAFLEAMTKLGLAQPEEHVGFCTHEHAGNAPSDPKGLTFMIGPENAAGTEMDVRIQAVVWPTEDGMAIGNVTRVPEHAKGRTARRHAPTERVGCCEAAIAVKDAVARGAEEAAEECRTVYDKTVREASGALEEAVAELGLLAPRDPPKIARQLTILPALAGTGGPGPYPLPPLVRRQKAFVASEF